ncbi:SgcJ/EcaC family oxidoreductase [Amycolatopsis sp. FDAARGOS 1241]|uniref:SgcJ/EcaC family oxidoreductase n=1 Tax=Amycolatopsis sp. FDAARGOS 1241 TaxID=2778070 RepID=UPI0019512715|nr:SgcJ/EcaC family oxidoreductase [Amycolatopsis sp. FDAARGOS 1241]QRP48371.1 SgcJ/EcaC family oxidoreductase [Amycolatopsis sp. FDAARGOS 1241]
MTRQDEVLAVLGRLADAWNSGDAAAYAEVFTEDADYVTFFGLNLPGRERIESSHRALFEGPLRGSKLGGFGEASVRFPREDVAIVVSGGGSALDGGDAVAQGRGSTVTFVLVRETAGWRITSFQNTRVSDPRAVA